MKYLFLITLIFFTSNCSKPKVVLICGDHICINKAEAEKYFEENLTLEVKVIDKKVKKEINLVEINLNNNQFGNREVNIVKKDKSDKQIKTLSKKEIKKIKQDIKNKNKERKISRKTTTKKEKKLTKTINVNKKKNKLVDVCTKIEKCNIDEISKYILKEGKKKDFPDMTIRQ